MIYVWKTPEEYQEALKKSQEGDVLEHAAPRGTKFRAWHPRWEEYIYFKNISLEYGSSWSLRTDANDSLVYTWYDRKDVVIQEWTGLQDKAGKDIYEGDILYSTDDLAFYPVVFYMAMFCVYIKDENIYSPLYEYIDDSVVVTNAVENPEYLKEPQKLIEPYEEVE